MKKLLTPLAVFLIAVFVLSSFGLVLAANPTKALNDNPSVSSSQTGICKCVSGQACKCKAPCKCTGKACKCAPAAKICKCKDSTCKCAPGKACVCKTCKCPPGKACVCKNCKCPPGAVKAPEKNCSVKCDPKACSPKNCPTQKCQ